MNECAKIGLKKTIEELETIMNHVDDLIRTAKKTARAKGIGQVVSIDLWRAYGIEEPGTEYSPENICRTLFHREAGKRRGRIKSFTLETKIAEKDYTLNVSYVS